MPTTPNGYSLLTFALPISSFAAGYIFGYETAADDALTRIKTLLYRMQPKPPIEDLEVEILHLMQSNLPRIAYGTRFSAALVLISLAIIASIAYAEHSLDQTFWFFAAIFAGMLFLVGQKIAEALWKGEAKLAFVSVHNGMSKNFTKLCGSDISLITVQQIFLYLMVIQANICGTLKELPSSNSGS
jgi:hypothetical protein